MIYGYARVSTQKQKLERQIANIASAAPEAVVVCDKYTGTKMTRPEWERILRKIRKGDKIIFDSVSRMSRNAEEGFALYCELMERGIELVFLKEPHINTAVYLEATERVVMPEIRTGDQAADKLMNTIASALKEYTLNLAEHQIQLAFDQAEKEVADLHKRTSEGIEAARRKAEADGREWSIGIERGRKLTTKKSIEAKTKIRQYSRDFDGTLTDADCMKIIGISRNTFYKYKRELIEGNE